jgi:hypothetical protein
MCGGTNGGGCLASRTSPSRRLDRLARSIAYWRVVPTSRRAGFVAEWSPRRERRAPDVVRATLGVSGKVGAQPRCKGAVPGYEPASARCVMLSDAHSPSKGGRRRRLARCRPRAAGGGAGGRATCAKRFRPQPRRRSLNFGFRPIGDVRATAAWCQTRTSIPLLLDHVVGAGEH